jgi:hypothetical protein
VVTIKNNADVLRHEHFRLEGKPLDGRLGSGNGGVNVIIFIIKVFSEK